MVFVLPAKWTQAKLEDYSNAQNKAGDLKIIVTSLEINDKALKLVYQIRNNSEEDAWIFVGTDRVAMTAEVFMAEDGQKH